eukprot:scaffold5944_cov102-Skeletonema_marinoi.AAC.7
MSGLRAALSRGVCPNMSNTVGWTPSHAAAAGGHTKALRLLAKSGADFTIADRGGNLPAHQAAKNGHVHALRVLSEHGADITKVRLSQAKGKAAPIPTWLWTLSQSSDTDCNNEEPSYVETVRQMKRNKKQRQKQKQGRKETAHQTVFEDQDSNTIDDDQASATFSSDDSTEDSMGVNGFAALLLGDDSDSE